MKDKFLKYWDENRYQFKYHQELYEEDTFDFDKLNNVLLEISKFEIGESFTIFDSDKFKIVNRNERYLILYNEEELHSVLDLYSGLCGGTDRLFTFTNFNDKNDTNELLSNLDNKSILLSYRSSVPVSLCI